MDITYEKFEQFALNSPCTGASDSLFMLREYYVEGPSDVAQQMAYDYKLRVDGITFCKTLQDAELAMKAMVAKRKLREEIDDLVTICFMIRETLYNRNIYPESVWNCLSVRTYNADGELVEKTLCVGDCLEDVPSKSTYYGRTPQQLRFKKGDIVQYLNGDKLSLGVVIEPAPTISRCWRIWQNTVKRMKSKYWSDCEPTIEDILSMYDLDISDDSYIIIDGPGYEYHSHIPSVSLLAPTFPVPEQIKQKLKGCYEFTMKELENE